MFVWSLLLALLVAPARLPPPPKANRGPHPWLMAVRLRISAFPLSSEVASLRLFARRRRRVNGLQTRGVAFTSSPSPTSRTRTW